MATAAGNTFSFDRTARLRRPAQFKRVFARPIACRDSLFRVLARPGSRDDARLGLAVSRRVSSRAVDRNRLKRLVRESFRRHRRALALGGGLDLVVLPLPAAVTTSNAELFASLERHWRRLIAKREQTTEQRGAA